MPAARRFAARVELLNHTLRAVSAGTGGLLVDLATYPIARDPRLLSEDRLHANSLGHERIAAALGCALGLPGADANSPGSGASSWAGVWETAVPRPGRCLGR